jgi:hypothetical protein
VLVAALCAGLGRLREVSPHTGALKFFCDEAPPCRRLEDERRLLSPERGEETPHLLARREPDLTAYLLAGA